MARTEPLSYAPREVLSYLPTGWTLDDNAGDGVDAGAWQERRDRWVTRLVDGAEQPWELAVDAAAAERDGRLEALRRAVDRLYREALG